MNKKRFFMKKLGMLILLLCICFAVLPSNVDAKKKAKTVKIHSFSSGNKKVDKKIRSIIKKQIKPKMSTAERGKAIHDYIILNCKYDYKNYLKGTIPSKSYTAEGVILKKKAVCAGYAEAFQLFMDALGIPCKTITGTTPSGGHAWNIVKINKKWYQIDLTWDDPVPDEKGRVVYNYFLITDKQMKKDHRWNSSIKCKTSNNKFITLIGKVSKTKESAAKALYEGCKKSSDKTTTIIVPKKLCAESVKSVGFTRELVDIIKEKYQERIISWSYIKSEYGSYNLITIKILQVEEIKKTDTQIPTTQTQTTPTEN